MKVIQRWQAGKQAGRQAHVVRVPGRGRDACPRVGGWVSFFARSATTNCHNAQRRAWRGSSGGTAGERYTSPLTSFREGAFPELDDWDRNSCAIQVLKPLITPILSKKEKAGRQADDDDDGGGKKRNEWIQSRLRPQLCTNLPPLPTRRHSRRWQIEEACAGNTLQ